MTKLELMSMRAKAWETAKAFLDTHRNADGMLSAEDDATYANMEVDISNYGKEIARMERQEAIDRELAMPVNTPITAKPESTKQMDQKKGRATDAYNKAFWAQVRNKNDYEIRNALSEGVDTEGGYLVPDEFEKTLIDKLSEENVIRKLAHVFTTSSGSHKIPVVATKGTAAWTDEGEKIEESEDTFGQEQIDAYKVATLIKVSEELLNDSAFNLESYFRKEFSRRIGNKEEEAFLTGDGNKKPTGLLTRADVGVSAASATSITADELIDLYFSLRAPYRKNAVWVLNDDTMKLIRKLKDNNGQYLWQPALHEGGFDTILGKRIYTSAFMPTAEASAKTIAFGDFDYYWIGDRVGITFRRLNEKYAENGQVGFLASKRLDGKLILPEAIKVLQQKGASSTSGS
jgi:HK97 family phage major capsid protein